MAILRPHIVILLVPGTDCQAIKREMALRVPHAVALRVVRRVVRKNGQKRVSVSLEERNEKIDTGRNRSAEPCK